MSSITLMHTRTKRVLMYAGTQEGMYKRLIISSADVSSPLRKLMNDKEVVFIDDNQASMFAKLHQDADGAAAPEAALPTPFAHTRSEPTRRPPCPPTTADVNNAGPPPAVVTGFPVYLNLLLRFTQSQNNLVHERR